MAQRASAHCTWGLVDGTPAIIAHATAWPLGASAEYGVGCAGVVGVLSVSICTSVVPPGPFCAEHGCL